MSVTTYEVLSANTVSELVALVNAATGKTPLGEIFIQGGAPRQVVVTGEPVSGYISEDYRAVVGVGQVACTKEQSVSLVRCADATSWEYGKPDGVVFSFQVSL